MSTAVQPVLKELLADIEKYPDTHEYTDVDGKKVTLGELRKGAASAAIPPSPNAETDKRVTEVLNDKKKKKHPVEARIAELTAKNKELEAQRQKDKEEVEKKLAEQNEKNIAAELERRKAEAAANDKRPIREECSNDAEFTQKMAEWVIRQQDKIAPKVAAVAAPAEPAKVDPVTEARLKEEYNGFLEAGNEFIKRNPDFNEVLDAAGKRGLTIDNRAQYTIIKLRVPQVAYYLARPENETTARKFMAMDGFMQSIEVARIAERLAAHPEDFVSSAGKPGQRLNGGAVTDVRAEEMDTDAYLAKRRADIKAGLRRR